MHILILIIELTPLTSWRSRFEKFDVEWHPNCLFDYVTVYNGDRITGLNHIGQFCGHTAEQRPTSLTSRTNQMLISFVTDASKAFEGFFATYEQLNGKTEPIFSVADYVRAHLCI